MLGRRYGPFAPRGTGRLKLDLYRRTDAALVVVPSRFAHGLPTLAPTGLRYIRSVRMELGVLGDGLLLYIGLHGFGIAFGADEALLRNCPTDERLAV